MDIYAASAHWIWGLVLIVLTVTIHVVGVVAMALAGIRLRSRVQVRHLGLLYVMPIVIAVLAAIGLMLTVLHLVEATLWAASYLLIGAFDSAFDAMLFSVGAMTTVGAPGLVLPRPWQMLGVLEAGNGALLFGVSTAYVFGVMQAYWPLLQTED